jgi:hypothetical protein
MAILGVPRNIRTNGGSQFNNQLMEEFSSMMNYHHTVIVANHPQANGLSERCTKEVVKNLKLADRDLTGRSSIGRYGRIRFGHINVQFDHESNYILISVFRIRGISSGDVVLVF